MADNYDGALAFELYCAGAGATHRQQKTPAARRSPPASSPGKVHLPLTADNQMTRKPNLALNAEMKAVAERLILPAMLVHFFRFAPTAIE